MGKLSRLTKVGGAGGGSAELNRVAEEGLTDKVTFEARLERGEEGEAMTVCAGRVFQAEGTAYAKSVAGVHGEEPQEDLCG